MSAQQIIDDSRAFADTWVDAADALIEGLTEKIEGADRRFGLDKVDLVYKKPEIDTANIERIAISDLYQAADTLRTKIDRSEDFLNDESIKEITKEPPVKWDKGVLSDKVVFDAAKYVVNDFAEVAPKIDLGKAPDPLSDSYKPRFMPATQNIAIPSNFAVGIPSAPVMTGDVNLPHAPAVVFPKYLEEIDWGAAEGIEEPDFAFTFNEQAYQSAMMDGLKSKLMADLAAGGYGIEPGDEVGLWERARDREAASSGAEVQALARDFASRGFMVPPGSMFGALEGIRAKAMDAAATLSRDVALKRADLYVQNRQFTIQQVKELETLLLNQHMAVMERILRAAQVSAQFVVDQYRARLDKTRLAVDVIQARVQSFRELVAAESTKVAIYNAQISAELAKTEVDKNKLEAYRASLSGVESTVNVYRLQVQAAEAAIQAERSKVEMWKAEVDGYLATVKAKEAEFSGYESRIRGEQARVQLFSEQVRAHAAKVDAKRVEADIKSMEVRSYTESANVALRAFEAELSANQNANNLHLKSEERAVRAFEAKVNAYRADVDGAAKLASIDIDQKRLVTSSKLDAARLVLEAQLAEINADFKATGFVVGSKQKLVDLYKEMIGASLGALNSIASIAE
jgi:hypothetical protein